MKKGLDFGKWLCKLGWHKKPYILIKKDGLHGICDEYQCKRRGFVGMVDSQGNLF